MRDRGGLGDRTQSGVYYMRSEPGGYIKCITQVEKWTQADFDAGLPPYEVAEVEGNIRLIGGASIFWERLITKNPSTSSTGAQLQALSTDNAVIGVGNSTVTAAKTQKGLQATTDNRAWSTMSSGFPAHTDATTSTGGQDCQFKVSFGATEANFAWREWVTGNSTVNSTAGRYLHRTVGNLGTKTTGTWTLTLTLTETT